MTKQPWSVQVDDSLAVARQMLAEREIHHLPVLDQQHLVGMLRDRDVVAGGHTAKTVGQAMYVAHEVDANTALVDVLELMVTHQSDALVVTRAGHIEGIFTAMDAVRVLFDRLRKPERSHARA